MFCPVNKVEMRGCCQNILILLFFNKLLKKHPVWTSFKKVGFLGRISSTVEGLGLKPGESVTQYGRFSPKVRYVHTISNEDVGHCPDPDQLGRNWRLIQLANRRFYDHSEFIER